jgi:hypothetical protein
MKYCKFFLILLIMSACKTAQNQPTRPMESYETVPTPTPAVSTVNIPLRLQGYEIEHLLNNKLNGVIYEDKVLEDDGLLLKATKNNWISLVFNGFEMTYKVPLNLWVFKKVIGARGIEAEGDIVLTFKTSLEIRPDWTIEPKTELAGYEWTRNMAVKTGLGNLDIKYIASTIIERSRQTLVTNIDQQIRANSQIRGNLESAWQTLQNPINIASSYGSWWVKITPQSVEMTPLRTTQYGLESVISVSSVVDVLASQTQPLFRQNTYLPPFRVGVADNNDFRIGLTTEIPLIEAEAIAKSVAVGQVFEPASGKKIEITNIQLFGQNEKLIVNTSFKGSYKGSLYLVGRPIYNAKTNTIELADLDYEVNTKSFLIKSATWMFDKTILKKMKEACVFNLDDNLTGFKTLMNDQLRDYKMNQNVKIQGYVDQLRVEDVKLSEDKIKIFVSSTGKINVNIEGLDKF